MYYYGYNGCSGMNTGNYGYQPTYVGNTTGGYSWGAAAVCGDYEFADFRNCV